MQSFSRSALAINALWLLSSASCLWASQYCIETTAPLTITLPVTTDGSGADYLRGKDGVWHPLKASVAEELVTLSVTPTELAPRGASILLMGKPGWMDLYDADPPRLLSAVVNGIAVPLGPSVLDLGSLPAGQNIAVQLTCFDAANPLDTGNVTCVLETPGGQPDVRADAAAGPPAEAIIGITFAEPQPGAYRSTIVIRDCSPDRNALRIPLMFTLAGITVEADKQRVHMTTSGGEYVFQADREKQLRLPNGVWAKLTSNVRNTWLYPQRITEVTPVAQTTDGQRVSVITSTQGLDGTPVEGLGSLEYTFDIRHDTPALLVASRSVNVSVAAQPVKANWGWLPGAHYVLPEGPQNWRGVLSDSYVTIGPVGWLWLAPVTKGNVGIVWVSDLIFGESRFDTMLLYSEIRDCESGESIDMRFAIAPAATADEGRAMAAALSVILETRQQDDDVGRP